MFPPNPTRFLERRLKIVAFSEHPLSKRPVKEFSVAFGGDGSRGAPRFVSCVFFSFFLPHSGDLLLASMMTALS